MADVGASAAVGPGPEPAAEVRDLWVWLRRDGVPRPVLHGIDLTVARGEVVLVMGESGAGKTVLGRAMAGLLPVSAGPRVVGSVRIDGTEIVGAGPAVLRRLRPGSVGHAGQDAVAGLNPTMRIGRQVDEVAGDRAASDRALIAAGLPDPGRYRRAYPHQLSGGQRQRVLLAIAIARQPHLLIVDEPTSALDPVSRQRVLTTLRRLRERSTGILFISHDLDAAAEIADRVAVLHDGRLVEVAAAERVLAGSGSAVARRQLDARHAPVPTRAPAPAPCRWAARLADVSRTFGRGSSARRALDRVSLDVDRGRTLVIVGESGAGKTTLLRILAGIDRPDPGGSVTWSAGVRPQLVFQDPAASLTPWLTVAETLTEPLRVAGVARGDRTRRVAAALDRVALDAGLARVRTRELSGGQQQRVAIARATMVRTDLLLCDEPTSALDPATAAELIGLLRRIRDDLDLALVVVTHDRALAGAVADRVLVMRDGRVVDRTGTDPSASEHPYTRQLLDAAPGAVPWVRAGKAPAGPGDLRPDGTPVTPAGWVR